MKDLKLIAGIKLWKYFADQWKDLAKYFRDNFYKEMEHRKTLQTRLFLIRGIIERVDYRAQFADGPVTPTLEEMTPEEMSEIYKLAGGKPGK